jgi:hypothetical protein
MWPLRALSHRSADRPSVPDSGRCSGRPHGQLWLDEGVTTRSVYNRTLRPSKTWGYWGVSFYVARLQRLKALGVLIEAGADPTILDPQGRDAIDIAPARRLTKDLITRLADLKRRIQPA